MDDGVLVHDPRREKQDEGSFQLSQRFDGGTESGQTAQAGDEDEALLAGTKHGGHQEEEEEEDQSPSFILDSGAVYHVTGDKALLSEFTEGSPAGGVATDYQARDGSMLSVTGFGTLACDNFRLPNVLFVPDLRARAIAVGVACLVSLRQLAAERDCHVVFGGGRCYVKDQSTGKLVGQGRLHKDDGLYHLQFLRIESSSISPR